MVDSALELVQPEGTEYTSLASGSTCAKIWEFGKVPIQLNFIDARAMVAAVLRTPDAAVSVVPSGFEHPIWLDVAVVQLITPEATPNVLPSPLTPPSVDVVAWGSV